MKAQAKAKKEVHAKIKKSMKLQGWNSYDPDYNTEFWYNGYFYGEANCGGDVIYQAAMDESYCYVAEVTSSTGQNYSSGQILFKSDCSSQTLVFYTSDDCSGTPAEQSNTQSVPSTDECEVNDDDDDDGLSSETYKIMCDSSAAMWSGNGGYLKITTYEQTATCSNTPSGYLYIGGGCYSVGASESVLYGNQTYHYPMSDNCTGISDAVYLDGSCGDDDSYYYYGDDDDGDDDDNLIDDGMFSSVDMNEEESQTMIWEDVEPTKEPTKEPTTRMPSQSPTDGSSMGAILNYSLSVALLIMSCSLFF